MADGWGGITNKQWTGLGFGAASFLPMMFGGGGNDTDISRAIGDLQNSSTRLQGTAKETGAQGSTLLNPAIDYLKAIVGGDRQAIMAATMPERRRVIDQYDAAKKSIAEFAPRGGGTAGAVATLNANQAGDLAQVGAQARTQGVNTAGQLGASLKSLGVGAEGLASQNLNTILQTYIQKGQQQGQSAASLGEGLASLVATIFL